MGFWGWGILEGVGLVAGWLLRFGLNSGAFGVSGLLMGVDWPSRLVP